MKEDHGFTIEDENNVIVEKEIVPEESSIENKIEETEIKEETLAQETKEEVKIDNGDKPKVSSDKVKKKPINIGIIFILFLVFVFAFIYIFLGQPIINFHATENGEQFYITFSKIEEKKAEDLEKELNSKEAVKYEFKSGVYYGTKGAFLSRNGNSLIIYLGDDPKPYTVTINESEKDYYVEGDKKIPFVYEYVEYTNDDGLIVNIKTSVDGISYKVGNEHSVFLHYNEEPLEFEGLYRSGEKYVLIYNTNDFMNRLNQVNVHYYDGVEIRKVNIFELSDDNNDDKYGDSVTKDGNSVLRGKMDDGSNNTYSLNILKNGMNYNISISYDIPDMAGEYVSINGTYTK